MNHTDVLEVIKKAERYPIYQPLYGIEPSKYPAPTRPCLDRVNIINDIISQHYQGKQVNILDVGCAVGFFVSILLL